MVVFEDEGSYVALMKESVSYVLSLCVPRKPEGLFVQRQASRAHGTRLTKWRMMALGSRHARRKNTGTLEAFFDPDECEDEGRQHIEEADAAQEDEDQKGQQARPSAYRKRHDNRNWRNTLSRTGRSGIGVSIA